MPLFTSFLIYLCIFAYTRVIQISKAMQTTAIRTVANSLPNNEIIFLTLLILRSYISDTILENKYYICKPFEVIIILKIKE